jgi:putative ABC transport system permease protein
LVEAVLMTFWGGAAGVLLGIFASSQLTWIVHWTTKVSIFAVLGALVFSVLVGMIFGILPARKAAELNPIDALRYD